MVSVVIPACNEQGAIADTVKAVRAALVAAGEAEADIIVVDDGSADSTADEAERAGARVIRNKQNIGYGHALKVGIAAAADDTIVILDADGTYPADRIGELLAKYREGFHMVVGQRTGPAYRESWIKAPLRVLLRLLVEFTAGRRMPDANSGMRVFSRAEAIPFFPFVSNAFSFTTSITLAYMLQYRYVAYVPIPYHERIGETKVRLFRDSLRMLQYIVSAILFYNPIKLFIVLCLGLIVVGGATLVFALVLHSLFLAGVGVATLLTAVPVFAAGLLADAARQYAIRLSDPTGAMAAERGDLTPPKP